MAKHPGWVVWSSAMGTTSHPTFSACTALMSSMLWTDLYGRRGGGCVFGDVFVRSVVEDVFVGMCLWGCVCGDVLMKCVC